MFIGFYLPPCTFEPKDLDRTGPIEMPTEGIRDPDFPCLYSTMPCVGQFDVLGGSNTRSWWLFKELFNCPEHLGVITLNVHDVMSASFPNLNGDLALGQQRINRNDYPFEQQVFYSF